MGATDFSHAAVGKTARDAFSNANAEARYEYGHQSYSGTITEKSGFKLISAPVGCRADINTLIYWICQAESESDLKTIPKKYRAWAASHSRAYLDKWGSALAIELSKSATKAYKASNGLKGTQKRVFVFFGIASC